MGLSVGIIGLPNVGKSTTFNALTKTQNAQSANYPFCTIDPNKAVVPVPDSRIVELERIVKPEKTIYSTIEFVDIAGLVRGASKGEGLGNQFLSNIKEVDALLHVVRCFDDNNIVHVEGRVDPVSDVEIIELELLFADLDTLDKRIERLRKSVKSNKESSGILDVALQLKKHLEANNPVRTFDNKNSSAFLLLNRDLRFLTNKQVIYAANVDDPSSAYVDSLKEYAFNKGSEVIVVSSKMEEDMIDMDPYDRLEFLDTIGIKEGGLEQIIRTSFNKLDLISYFTVGVKEVRSWTIRNGVTAPSAAGVIHNDFEKGFIKAEIISYDDFIKCGSEQKVKEAGLMRIEGKDYIMKDGDIAHFRFNL